VFLASQHGEHSQHHRYEFVRQRAVKEAARTIGLSGPVNGHMLWHSLAVHLLEDGYDSRTVQEFLGYRDVKTTMIYAHVLNRSGQGVYSPIDRR
jgi:site-specific recombinase XerD